MQVTRYDRRAFMAYFTTAGLGTTLFPGVLWAKVSSGMEITAATIAQAEEVAGLSFEPEEREMMVENLRSQAQRIAGLHSIPLDNSVPPAIVFNPLPPGKSVAPDRRRPAVRSRVSVPVVTSDLEALAFAPVTTLSELIRTQRVTSLQLTRMYLARLRKYDPVLKCVVSLTEERALRQAREADAEIARGRYRGALHGIPWGAKDLLAVRGYKTTWGAGPFREQVIDADATVVERLDAAGAVLVAKLTLGELAQGDIWFGGTTKNPWKIDQGSSGSSAGPASATAAGLVGFSIGSETLGSISSPSTRCGTTGLRPTFGRVPRTGAMALSWSMDKLGPICRSVEDCALVLDAIAGTDGHDLTAHDASFNWDATRPLSGIRIGYFKSVFDRPELDAEGKPQHPTKKFDDAAVAGMQRLGVKLIPVEVPEAEYDGMRLVLDAECGAAFDELTRSGRDAEMTRQTADAWPHYFRVSRFVPGVDYINANRARTLAMRKWAELFSKVDVIITPTSGSAQL